jgi:hypothetical protein
MGAFLLFSRWVFLSRVLYFFFGAFAGIIGTVFSMLTGFYLLQKKELSNLTKNEFEGLQFFENCCYTPLEEFPPNFTIFYVFQFFMVFFEISFLIFLVFIIINVNSFNKTILNFKNLAPLISLCFLSIKVTVTYPELLFIIFLMTLYFLVRPSILTNIEEGLLTCTFCILLLVSAKLGNDTMLYAFLILFGYLKSMDKFNERQKLVVVGTDNQELVIETNVLFAKPFRDLAIEIAARFTGERFSSVPKTQRKVAYAFKKVVQKGQEHPSKDFALKFFGGSAVLSTYVVSNNYYLKHQVSLVDNAYDKAVKQQNDYSKFDDNLQSTQSLILKDNFIIALNAKNSLKPVNIHEAVLNAGIQKNSDPTFKQLLEIGEDVIKAIG